MRKFYVEVSSVEYIAHVSYVKSLGFIVVYAAGDNEAFALAEALHTGFEIGWPTEEEPQ